MLVLKIAFRNIFRQKRRSVLTILTMLGGFALAALSIAWSDGTYSNVINMFTRNQMGHIQIHREGYLKQRSIHKTIDDYDAINQGLISLDGIEAFSPRLYSAGLASVGEKSSAVQITGIDPKQENITTRFDKKITGGTGFSETPNHQVIIGEGLAKRLEAEIGDELVIVSQAADGSIANDLYKIIGNVSSGNQIADQITLYMHLADAQELFVLQGRIHEICVVVENLNSVSKITEEIETIIADPQLDVATWKEFAASFYRAMIADQKGSWIMLVIIALVVAVGVLNTVLMTVLERRREYGVLRAVGTAPSQIFKLVVLEVLIMAVIGICLGFGISLPVNYYLSLDGIAMPEPMTYGGIEFTHMYTEINTRSYIIPALTVILTALIVSIFPAGRAARVAPAQAMRIH